MTATMFAPVIVPSDNLRPPSKARAEIRARIRETVDDDRVLIVKAPEVKDQVSLWLREERPDLLENLLAEILDPMIYDEVTRVVAATRGGKAIPLSDGQVVTKVQFDLMVQQKLNEKWGKWLENNGAYHVRLLVMTKSDLLAAAVQRERRARHEIVVATLWRRLAEGMDEGDKVGDRYTLEDIERLRQEIDKSMPQIPSSNGHTPQSEPQAS